MNDIYDKYIYPAYVWLFEKKGILWIIGGGLVLLVLTFI